MSLIIHGRVQGVEYRYGIINQIEAENIVLNGHIKNLANGTVEIIAQGSIEALKDLRRIAATGVSSALVRDVEESVYESKKLYEGGFNIEI